MAISNTVVLIKRSTATSKPSSLNFGELAYSTISNTIFIGTSTGGVVNVGGQFYTSQIDNATSANGSGTLVRRDSAGNVAFNYVSATNITGALAGNANTATYLQNPQNFSISGGDITASAQLFNGDNTVTLNASLNSVSGLSAGFYGGATQSTSTIPVIQVAANGRIMSIANTQVTSSFTITDGTNSNTVYSGSSLTFTGNKGITTTVSPSGESVTFGTDSTVVRSNTALGGPQTIGTDVNISGNLAVSGTVTYVNTAIMQTTESVLHLAANNTVGDVIDIGIVGDYNNGTSNVSSGLVRDAGSKNWYLFQNIAAGSVSGNTIANNLFTTSNTATLYTNLVAQQANASSANITSASIGTLTLGQALAVTSGGTGTTTSTGTGSVVLNQSPTFTGTVNFASANVTGMNVATINVTTINVSSVQANSINIGTLTYVAAGAFVEFGANTNSYQQVVIQNASQGNDASADFIVSNADSSDTYLYGDFGINGPNFSQGPGSFNLANAVYLYSQSSDLAIGTQSANAIHFIVNDGNSDAMTINGSTGAVTLAVALGVPSGGTGQTSFNNGSILVGSGSGALSVLANSTYTATGSGATNSTITSLTVDPYGRTTAATYSAISGLTVGQGGTGASIFTQYGVMYGNGTGALQASAQAGISDMTFSNQILTVSAAGIPMWTTTMDGGAF